MVSRKKNHKKLDQVNNADSLIIFLANLSSVKVIRVVRLVVRVVMNSFFLNKLLFSGSCLLGSYLSRTLPEHVQILARDKKTVSPLEP